MRRFTRPIRQLVAATLWIGAAQAACACPGQQPIRVLVPYAAGGSLDLTTRLVAAGVSARLHRPVDVVNVPGASGLIAVHRLLRAAHDGCTLLSGTVNTVALLPMQRRGAGFVPGDLRPVGRVGATGLLFVASAKAGIHDWQGLEIAVHDARTLHAGHPGVDSLQALALGMLETRLRTQFVQVPYSGAGAMVGDLVSGRIELAALAAPAALALLKQGSAVLLDAVRTPDGAPLSAWNGWFAATRTPASATEPLRVALGQALGDPAVLSGLNTAGVTVRFDADGSFADEIAASVRQLGEFAAAPPALSSPPRLAPGRDSPAGW